jgi:hypothetical protein
MKLKLTRIIIFMWVSLSLAILFTPQVSAQQASEGFSGSDLSNYTCPPLTAYAGPYSNGKNYPEVSSDFKCRYTGQSGTIVTNASIKPPTLKVLQFMFLRVLYAAWGVSGIIFTLIMVWLGFKWMTSGGDPAVINDVKKRAKNWFIGLMLIFLSYPALNTLFNVIGLSEDECFQELNLPAFQFFFPQACVADGGTPAP